MKHQGIFFKVSIVMVMLFVGYLLGCGEATESSSSGGSLTATITSSASGTTTTSPIPMTITFSAAATGLTTSDFTVTNGSVGNLVTSSTSVYTFDVTPTAYGTVSILLPAATVVNSSSVANVVSNTFSITYAATSSNQLMVGIDDPGKYSYVLHKNGAYSTACEVASTATAPNNDIACTLNINEGDLWFWGLKLTNTVPANMCRYMQVRMYYFYNHEIGYGPSNISVYLDQKNSGANIFNAGEFPNLPGTCNRGAGQANSCCVVDGVTQQPCTGFSEVSVDLTTGAPTCIYDRTAEDLPNCCGGTYNLFTEIMPAGGTAVTDASTANVAWGGAFNTCIAGPAYHTNWPKDATYGMPFYSVVHYAYAGLNDTWDLDVTSDFSSLRNVPLANYFTSTGNPHSHTANGAGSSNYPWAIDPIADRSGTPISIAEPYYVFSCMDAGFEITHRITLQIREWNTSSEFSLYQSSAGASGVPDVVVPAVGYSCNQIDANDGCNDFFDWDDFVLSQSANATYPANPYNNLTPANWRSNFPQIHN